MPHLHARMRRLSSNEKKAPLDGEDDGGSPNFYAMPIPDEPVSIIKSSAGEDEKHSASTQRSQQTTTLASSTNASSSGDGGGKHENETPQTSMCYGGTPENPSQNNFASLQGSQQEMPQALLNNLGNLALPTQSPHSQVQQQYSNFGNQSYAASSSFQPTLQQFMTPASVASSGSYPFNLSQQQLLQMNQSMTPHHFAQAANQAHQLPISNSIPLAYNAMSNQLLQNSMASPVGTAHPSSEAYHALQALYARQQLQNSMIPPTTTSTSSHPSNQAVPYQSLQSMYNQQLQNSMIRANTLGSSMPEYPMNMQGQNQINASLQVPHSEGNDHAEEALKLNDASNSTRGEGGNKFK